MASCRPYLNKVHVPAFDGKCSTELVPLRPSKELQREYLAYFLRAPSTVERISQRVAGARMPRADMNFVMTLPIPLPPNDEQRRIVDLLSRAENIVRMRREAEAKAKEIIPALFWICSGIRRRVRGGRRLGDWEVWSQVLPRAERGEDNAIRRLPACRQCASRGIWT